MVEDFCCKFRSDIAADVQHSLSASIDAARRDPETGIVTLTLNVVYTPLRQCRLELQHNTYSLTHSPSLLFEENRSSR